MKISQKIQLLKTISWTVISATVTTLIGWTVTGSLVIGLSVGIADRVIKTVLYYIHERIWHKKYKAAKVEAKKDALINSDSEESVESPADPK